MEKNFDYEKWSNEYHNEKVIDLKKYFTIEDFNLISKLKVKIKDKIYTKYEFEVLNIELLAYYKDEDSTKEELEFLKDLEKTGVSKEQYNNLLKKVEQIRNLYNF